MQILADKRVRMRLLAVALISPLVLSACDDGPHDTGDTRMGDGGMWDVGMGDTDGGASPGDAAGESDTERVEGDAGADATADGEASPEDVATLDAAPTDGGAAAIEMDAAGDGSTADAVAPDAAPGDASWDAHADAGGEDGGAAPYLCGQGQLESGELLDVGGYGEPLGLTHDRVLTRAAGRWVLWNIVDRAQLAHGLYTAGGATSMGGGRFAVETSAGIQTRSLTNGELVQTATALTAATLSRDGTYLWTSGIRLRAWSLDGTLLVDRNNYAGSQVSPDVGVLRVGAGPAGANVIETITTATGTSTNSSAFVGTFRGWFADGEHFLAATGNIVRVYTKDAQAPQVFSLTPSTFNWGGTGRFFWVYSVGYFGLYHLGQSTPVFESNDASIRPSVSGTRAWYQGSGTSGTTLELYSEVGTGVVHTSSPWTPGGESDSAFLTNDLGVWVRHAECGAPQLGDIDHPQTPSQPVGCGRIRAIEGSANGRVAIATCGRVLWYDLNGGTPRFGGELPYQTGPLWTLASVQLSNDGTVLGTTDQRATRLYQLPGGVLFKTFTYPNAAPSTSMTFRLSSSGAVVVHYECPTPMTCERYATSTSGATVFTTTAPYAGNNYDVWPLSVSADDSRFAVGVRGPTPDTSTQLFLGMTLSGAADGLAVDWLDATHLLVNRYRPSSDHPFYGRFDHAEIADTTGAVTRTIALPELNAIARIGSDRIYGRNTNRVYSVSDGSVVWSSSRRAEPIADIAGDYAVFVSGDDSSYSAAGTTAHSVRFEAY